MPKTGEINEVSGIYRSDCCGEERSMPKGHKFPPCVKKGYSCKGAAASWSLVRRATTS